MSASKPIQCQAAVAWSVDRPLTIETVTVAAPEKGEVRIKIIFTTVCHTDKCSLNGTGLEAKFPCILGHEASGIVESVGEGVTSVQIGDHVVPLYVPQCRECKFCKHPKTNLCPVIQATQNAGLMPNGTSRFSCKGQLIHHYFGTSTFSEYSVMPEISVAKVSKTAPLEIVSLLGCGISTGYGAALNTANVQAGDTVAIFGLGAVGLAVALGCKARGASRIIGLDVNEKKAEIAESFGITDFVNPEKHEKPIQEVLIGMTGGGLDHTFECVGNVNLMRAALEACHPGWGQAVIIGVSKPDHEIKALPFLLITGRVWKGSVFGGWKSRDSVPKLVELSEKGVLNVDKFITQRLNGLESVNEALELLVSGHSLRSVIKLSEKD